ncbi:hypothetical protein [Algoriphagus sp. NG3]|uniref:hypothetical protein n=1 Tax=Algoriphagus sp. NG3 TaxID=3097546 RepID=UPI002A81F605|nr:hypothetical protein [Algoriphagus sp. NG3]WPR76465.1 hypothetical protein SLW71_03780 [Algoriphagus sp. NG3]
MKNSNRTRKAKYLLVICSLLMGASCEEHAPCTSEGDHTTVETQTFFDLNTPYAWVQNVDDNETTLNLIIQNQQDYEKYVGIREDTLRPVIDFESNILLAGRIIHPSCGFIENQNVTKKCDDYYYTVILANGACGAVVRINYFVITTKVSSEVKFDIQFEN